MKKRRLCLLFLIFLLLFSSTLIRAKEVYRIVDGDSLYIIARKFGVTIEEIVAKNNLKEPDTIYPRQVLIIPEKTVYYVQAGDTLSQIAQKLRVELKDIVRVNNLDNPDYIIVGQILRIPEKESHQMISMSFISYEVQAGDSLYKISQKYGITINTLQEMNNIVDANYILVGDILHIPEYTFTQLRQMYPEHFFSQGRTNSKKIALTFDDGPDDIYTPAVLDVLKEHEVTATFFYMGTMAEINPEVVERTIKEGHVIANHSYTHPYLTKISDLKVYEEINKTEKVLEEITGLQTALIRPPYGHISQKIIEQLKGMDYRIIQWSVDSWDWRDRDVDQILINTIPYIRDDAIILFHSAGGGQSFSATVEALPELIYTLQVQGYEFVTVDEILDIDAYKN